MKNKILLSGLLSLVVLSLGLIISLTMNNQTEAQTSDEVVLDYEATRNESFSAQRLAKNERFNSKVPKEVISELPDGVENLPVMGHWWVGLSALPVDQAEAVILGRVVKREAFLSTDKSNIYTEYDVNVERVMKDASTSLRSDSTTSLVRNGGAVRFKSGKLQNYGINRLGVLKGGSRYVLFLSRTNGTDWFILTGYELFSGAVRPLDGSPAENPKQALPFEKYRNSDEERLLADIERALKGGVE